jgi:predicted secreted protein
MVAGEKRSFELPGLGAAGFIWQDAIDGPPGIVEVTWERGFPPGTPPPAPGVSAPEIATLHALSSGDVSLRLVQQRRWETDAEPRSEHTMLVHVDPFPGAG